MGHTQNIFHKIAENKYFHRFIIFVIVSSAVLIGLETYPALYTQYHRFFALTDVIIQGIFTIEIIIRILAFGNKPLMFFKESHNVVDFIITAIFYVPFGGPYAAVFRLIRIIRIFRLFTALPRLQVLVGALVKSFPSMGYISLLLLIQMYVFAVVGTLLFGHNDPENFGNLGNALLTLFQIITLEGWVEIMKAQPQNFVTFFYFISFILSGTMIILNLFIGVILNGFDEVKKEMETELVLKGKKPALEQELLHVSEQLDLLSKRILEVAEKEKIKSS